MSWEELDSIRGPRGEKGDPGTITGASGAPLPPGQGVEVRLTGGVEKHLEIRVATGEKGDRGPAVALSASAKNLDSGEGATVNLTGTEEARHLEIGVPRGLPGVNAVPAAEAVGTYLAAPDSPARPGLAAGVASELANPVSAAGTELRQRITQQATRKNATGLFGGDYIDVGETNHTSMIQEMLNDAGSGFYRAGLAPGRYTALGLMLPPMVVLDGWAGGGGGGTRFGSPEQYRYGAVEIKRPKGSTGTIITAAGAGSAIINLTVNGGGSDDPTAVHDPAVVLYGFEAFLDGFRVIDANGTGLDFQKANNGRHGHIYIDNCGRDLLAAFHVWSKAGVGSANESNNWEIMSLRVERLRGVGIDLGFGTTAEDWFEWGRIHYVHGENPRNDSENFTTAYPFWLIGNGRGLLVDGQYVYHGNGPHVRHQQQFYRSYGNGGIRFRDVEFNAQDPAIAPTTKYIDLVSGSDFIAEGRFLRPGAGAQILTAAAAYGKFEVTDTGRSSIQPHLYPTVNVPGATGVALLPKSNDSWGRVFYKASSAPTAGAIAEVVFYHNQGDRRVRIDPKNAATAAMGLSASVSADGSRITVRAANAPAASADIQFEYETFVI